MSVVRDLGIAHPRTVNFAILLVNVVCATFSIRWLRYVTHLPREEQTRALGDIVTWMLHRPVARPLVLLVLVASSVVSVLLRAAVSIQERDSPW